MNHTNYTKPIVPYEKHPEMSIQLMMIMAHIAMSSGSMNFVYLLSTFEYMFIYLYPYYVDYVDRLQDDLYQR